MELCKVYCGTYCIRGGSCVGLFCLRSSGYRGHSLNFMLVYVFGNCSRDQSTLKNGFLVGILPHWMIRDAFQNYFLRTLLPDAILLAPRWVCYQTPCVCRSVPYTYDYFARCLEMRDSSSLDSFPLYRTDFLSIYHLDVHSFIPRQTHHLPAFPPLHH
jgi:hypothetical protein